MSMSKRSDLFPFQYLVSLPPMHINEMDEDKTQNFIHQLQKATESLFVDNDETQLLTFCRSFVKQSPMLLHQALDKNHCNILSRYIPISLMSTLLCKNELGENILLHSIRLNRTELISPLLKKKYSEKLIYETDNEKNNVLHLVVLYSTSTEILDLLLNYFTENSVPIQQKFDLVNRDNQTPLQLAISKNKLSFTKSLLKYSNTNVCKTHDRTGDNLIHLAVRHADLTMVKYLIEDGKLVQQANQSNFSMTPRALAEWLQRHDIMIYLSEFDEDEDSSDD